MINRRKIIVALGAGAVARPIEIFAQGSAKTAQPAAAIPKIGVLWHAASEVEEAKFLAEVRRGLRDLGYVEGKNITLENRYPAEQPERFKSYAAELANLNVDVLVAVTSPAAMAAAQATSSIPVVILLVPDAVERKLVKSLGRPGGNVTGLSNLSPDISAKRLQMLKEAVPPLSRVAILINPNNSSSQPGVDEIQTAAEKLKLTARVVEIRSAEEIETAFASITQYRANGIILLPDGLFYGQRARIASLALKYRLPSMFTNSESVESGGLMSYGPNLNAVFYRTAYYVDKILKGAKPAELPVEQPTKFDLAINTKTAKTLGLTIPTSLLISANRMIE